MGEPHVISALVRKRMELRRDIADIGRQVRSIRKDMAHVDACLAMYGYEPSPDETKLVRSRRQSLFKHGQLKRMVLDIRREAGRPITNQRIAAEVIRLMGWTETGPLLVMLTAEVKDVTKRLQRRHAVHGSSPKLPL